LITPAIGRRVGAVIAAVLTVGALTACTTHVSATKKVRKAEVEKLSSDQLGSKSGQVPKKVTCPTDLKAKVGTAMRCELLTSTGVRFHFTVTVRSVKDNVAHFDIKVDDKPAS
jgi:hypothetical protein